MVQIGSIYRLKNKYTGNIKVEVLSLIFGNVENFVQKEASVVTTVSFFIHDFFKSSIS